MSAEPVTDRDPERQGQRVAGLGYLGDVILVTPQAPGQGQRRVDPDRHDQIAERPLERHRREFCGLLLLDNLLLLDTDQPLEDIDRPPRGDRLRREAHHVPAFENRLVILLQIQLEALLGVVPATVDLALLGRADPDRALAFGRDLERWPGEIEPPEPIGVEPMFLDRRREFDRLDV